MVTPLFLGFIGWPTSHISQTRLADPTVPQKLFSNRNADIGFFFEFEPGIFLASSACCLPLCFQASKDVSPLVLGIDTSPLNAFMKLTAVIVGRIMKKTGPCRPIHGKAWGFFSLAFGLLTTLDADSSTAKWVFYQIFLAIGLGVSFDIILPAIQSTLGESDVAVSTSILSFVRSFGIIWETAIPLTIFDSQFNANLSVISYPKVRAALGNGVAYNFATGRCSLASLPPVIHAQTLHYTRVQ